MASGKVGKPFDVPTSLLASFQNDLGSSKCVLKCVMVLEVDAEVSGHIFEVVATPKVRPCYLRNFLTVEPYGIRCREMTLVTSFLKRILVEVAMANRIGAHEQTSNVFPCFFEGRGIFDHLFTNAVYSDVNIRKPIRWVNERFPMVFDLSFAYVNDSDLAYAGAVGIGSLDIDGVEGVHGKSGLVVYGGWGL